MIYIWYNITRGRYLSGEKSAYLKEQSHFGGSKILIIDKMSSKYLQVAEKITKRLNERAHGHLGHDHPGKERSG